MSYDSNSFFPDLEGLRLGAIANTNTNNNRNNHNNNNDNNNTGICTTTTTTTTTAELVSHTTDTDTYTVDAIPALSYVSDSISLIRQQQQQQQQQQQSLLLSDNSETKNDMTMMMAGSNTVFDTAAAAATTTTTTIDLLSITTDDSILNKSTGFEQNKALLVPGIPSTSINNNNNNINTYSNRIPNREQLVVHQQEEQEQQNSTTSNRIGIQSPTPTRTPTLISYSHRGVLWKRRDVFKNNWRPRWFDLQSDHGLLSYYLLSTTSSSSSSSTTATTAMTPGSTTNQYLRSHSTNTNTNTSSIDAASRINNTTGSSIHATPYRGRQQREQQQNQQYQYRSRASSWDSATTSTTNITENSVDYDVVPRGSIYLWNNTNINNNNNSTTVVTVECNDKLSKPREMLYAFTIIQQIQSQLQSQPLQSISTSSQSSLSKEIIKTHLAARTPDMRDLWIYKIQQVINMNQNHNTTTTTGSNRLVDGTTGTVNADMNNDFNNNTVVLQQQVPSVIIEEEISSNQINYVSTAPLGQNNLNGLVSVPPDSHSDNDNTATTCTGSIPIDNNLILASVSNNNNNSSFTNDTSVSTTTAETITTTSTSFPSYCGWERDTFMNLSSSVYNNVPTTLAQTICDKIHQYLAIIDASSTSTSSTSTSTNQQQHTQSSSLGLLSNWKEVTTRTKLEHAHLQLKAFECDYDPFAVAVVPSLINTNNTPNNNSNNNNKKKYVLIKSTVIFPYPAKQVLHLVIDTNRRKQYETNIRHGQRIKQYNHHTFIDYYASTAVWPTAAREFVVALHWQVLTSAVDGQRAIVVLSFSCPESDSMRNVTPDHVRATLLISMSIIRDLGNNKCHVTRILSFDLGGIVPQNLSNTVMKQQLTMSIVLYEFLKKHEPGPPYPVRFVTSELLNNDDIIRTVIEYDESNLTVNATAPISPTSVPTPFNGNADIHATTDKVIRADTFHLAKPMSVWKIMLNILCRILLLSIPAILYRLLQSVQIVELPIPVFLIASFFAIRLLAIWEIGVPFKGDNCNLRHNDSRLFQSLRYNISVDLQGVIQYISKKKETQSIDISVVHIVTAAISRSLSKEKSLQCRRVHIPWLFIDRDIDTSFEDIGTTIFSDNGSSSNVQTIHGADRMDIYSIADSMSHGNGTNEKTKKQPSTCQCLVLAKKRTDDAVNDVTLDSNLHFCCNNSAGVRLAVVIGDVTLDHRNDIVPAQNGNTNNNNRTPMNTSNTSRRSSSTGTPRPKLSLSLTIIPPKSTTKNCNCNDDNACSLYDVQKYQTVAEDLKRLIQFPELCDQF